VITFIDPYFLRPSPPRVRLRRALESFVRRSIVRSFVRSIDRSIDRSVVRDRPRVTRFGLHGESFALYARRARIFFYPRSSILGRVAPAHRGRVRDDARGASVERRDATRRATRDARGTTPTRRGRARRRDDATTREGQPRREKFDAIEPSED
jgi:hypothetical protein